MLRRMLGRSQAPLAPPEVDAARCAHARVAHASCHACAEACPRDAWVIDDAQLGIATDRCTGCAVCAAVCPARAVAGESELLLRFDRQGRRLAFIACREATGAGPGVIPCLHGIGLRQLLRAWGASVRTIVAARIDCSGCRNAGTVALAATVERFNQALTARRLPAIELRELPLRGWRDALHDSAEQPGQSRRDFLRSALARGANTLLAPPPDSSAGAGSVLPSLPVPGPQPWSVSLDPQACSACDACTRICPTGALTLHDGDTTCYRIKAEHCTGCRLCRDICPSGAVQLRAWDTPVQQSLELERATCSGCGAAYHRVRGAAALPSHCAVCRLRPRDGLRIQMPD